MIVLPDAEDCTIVFSFVWTKHQKVYVLEQDAQLSQRDRAAGCVIVFAKSRRLELVDNVTDIIGLSSTTVI